MKILVISDLHAISAAPANGVSPSFISFSSPRRTASNDPLIGLRDLLKNGKVEPPDVLICAGDLADRADSQATEHVWRELMAVRDENNISHLLATCGNHDLDSRHKQNKFDPRGFLKALEPPFPTPGAKKHEAIHLEYWANNFSIIEDANWRLLNINSCAYHGYGESSEPELLHGRISDYTLDAIEARLGEVVSASPQKTNICLFHHHLRDVSSDEFEDKSTMKGANRLIKLLSKANLGEWFVLHGHRHRSDLYCAGGNSAPIVLSCASFSATRTGDENNPCPNQFYVIDLDTSQTVGFSKVKGTIQAWNWTPGTGWQSDASIPGGLPIKTGFGYRGDLHAFSDRLCEAVNADGRVTWQDALARFSELQYFMPSDLEALNGILSLRPEIVLSLEGTRIREIVRNA